MEQWRILVLGVVRLGLNADYDRLSTNWPISTARCARCWVTATGPTRPNTSCKRLRLRMSAEAGTRKSATVFAELSGVEIQPAS